MFLMAIVMLVLHVLLPAALLAGPARAQAPARPPAPLPPAGRSAPGAEVGGPQPPSPGAQSPRPLLLAPGAAAPEEEGPPEAAYVAPYAALAEAPVDARKFRANQAAFERELGDTAPQAFAVQGMQRWGHTKCKPGKKATEVCYEIHGEPGTPFLLMASKGKAKNKLLQSWLNRASDPSDSPGEQPKNAAAGCVGTSIDLGINRLTFGSKVKRVPNSGRLKVCLRLGQFKTSCDKTYSQILNTDTCEVSDMKHGLLDVYGLQESCSGQTKGGKPLRGLSKPQVFGPSGRGPENPFQPRVLNGKSTDACVSSLGWMGHCAGTLISDQWMVTAAHCTAGAYMQRGDAVHFGVNDLGKAKSCCGNHKSARIASVHIHPYYNWRTLANDIAMVKLDRKMPKGWWTCPDWDFQGPGENAVLMGFGSIEKNGQKYPSKLQWGPHQVRAPGQCPYYGFRHEKAICAEGRLKGKTVNSCSGDSGGPLYSASTKKLLGVVSAGSETCGDHPGIYTRMSFYKNWITKFIPETCDHGSLGAARAAHPAARGPGALAEEGAAAEAPDVYVEAVTFDDDGRRGG